MKITYYYTNPNFIKNEEYDKMENNRNKKLVFSVYDPGRFLEIPNATTKIHECLMTQLEVEPNLRETSPTLSN